MNWKVWLIALFFTSLVLIFQEQITDGQRGISEPYQGADTLAYAFKQQKSGLWVVFHGEVLKSLTDDDRGSRHQRFIVRVSEDHTVLVSHNIDLAPRVPLSKGVILKIRGQYEWNDKGGVVHWTHHDPQGRLAGGWIVSNRKTYK